jgi:tetratricopeptide (TPR) repeat protein
MLIDARKALDANDLVTSETMLTNSRQTKLFADVHKELQDRRALLVKAAVAKVPPEVKPVPVVPTVDLEAEKAKKIEKLLADAKAAKKDQKFTSAIGLLKECLRIDKKNPDCTVSLASTYATKGSATNNDADNDEAKRLYQTFLTIAPAGDPRIERVKGILKGEQ